MTTLSPRLIDLARRDADMGFLKDAYTRIAPAVETSTDLALLLEAAQLALGAGLLREAERTAIRGATKAPAPKDVPFKEIIAEACERLARVHKEAV